ncbi:16S rRNA pseudouridine(516) synthase RsuA [Shewanella sp. OPT22]|nr:16S rRNA pseudouridine(516) synthase RsuA [Shewanella sp. OPT22]
MRLDKFICETTELTRSQAKKLLKAGEVTCNGAVVKDASFKVSLDTEVMIDDQLLELIGDRYIMMNKPMDTICSTIDEHYPSVISLLDVPKAEELHIAGRLDADTTGLVLITNDGQWSHKITSPKKKCCKRYVAELADPIEESVIPLFAEGIQLNGEDGLTLPAELEILNEHIVVITIYEGKYHQVKRMFAAIGNKVIGLHREAIGQIELEEDIEPGEWRYLTEEEINSVK